jgi:hypothetical protein
MNDPFNERHYHSNLFYGSEIAIENMLKTRVAQETVNGF